jgi:hypothetical protein
MKTLSRIKNTTDVVGMKSVLSQVPEFELYRNITKRLEPEIVRYENAQTMTVDAFVEIHAFIFVPISNAAKGCVGDEHKLNNIMLNGITFGMATLHTIAPRLANWYVDIMCDPTLMKEIKFVNRGRTTINILLNLSKLHFYFSSTLIAILANMPDFNDIPSPPDDTYADINELREGFITVLSNIKPA